MAGEATRGHSRLPARRASSRAEASRGLEEVMAVCGRDGGGRGTEAAAEVMAVT